MPKRDFINHTRQRHFHITFVISGFPCHRSGCLGKYSLLQQALLITNKILTYLVQFRIDRLPVDFFVQADKSGTRLIRLRPIPSSVYFRAFCTTQWNVSFDELFVNIFVTSYVEILFKTRLFCKDSILPSNEWLLSPKIYIWTFWAIDSFIWRQVCLGQVWTIALYYMYVNF